MNEQEIIPRRFWWVKRLCIAYVVLAAGVVGLRYQWLNMARAKVDGQVASYRAQGQPVLVEDFRKPALADDQNAAVLLESAEAQLTRSRDDNEIMDAITINSPQSDVDKAQEVLSRQRLVLDNVRRAWALGKANWNIEFKPPLFSVMLSHLNDLRGIANVVRVAALVESRAGNHREALEHCRDMAFIARSIQDEPFLVSHLVSAGIDSMAAAASANITPAIRAADAQTRESINGFIAELLDDRMLRQSVVNAVYGERAAQLDIARYLSAGNSGREIGIAIHDSGPQAFIYWWLSPIFEQDAAEMLHATTLHLASAQAPDSVQSRQLSPRQPNVNGGSAMMLRPISRMFMPAFRGAFWRHHSVQKDRNFAAIELASVLYTADHGKPPQRIEDLVPKYLPRVPGDPVNGGVMTIATTQPATKPAEMMNRPM